MTIDSNLIGFAGQGADALASIFLFYRAETIPAGRIVTGRLRPGLEPESPPVQELLKGWPGSHSVRSGAFGWEVLLFEPERQRERWWLHGALLALTLFSTVAAGSLLAGHWPIGFMEWRLGHGWWIPVPVALDPGALAAGLPFGLALVGILALHEAGHYLAARHHSISVTPPFFIPFPPYVSVIGTLGAFIRLRSPVLARGQLLDVGAAGPLVSFVVSLPLLWWGLAHSRVLEVPVAVRGAYLVRFGGEWIWLGGSLAFSAMTHLVSGPLGAGRILELHPVAFAGWLGLFVTALNLLPISQLDGGHILYALAGSRQKWLGRLFFAALLPLGFVWAGWWVWAVLVLAVGRGRLAHPPLFDAEERLTRVRLAAGLASVAVFVLCFAPVPFGL